jgi:hypothetical protein
MLNLCRYLLTLASSHIICFYRGMPMFLIRNLEITIPSPHGLYPACLLFTETFRALLNMPNLLNLTLRNVKFDV